jgi:hypothetical protein
MYRLSSHHLHDGDARLSSGMDESAVQCNERAMLLLSTRNQVRIVAVNVQIGSDDERLHQIDLEETYRDFLVDRNCSLRLGESDPVSLQHGRERITDLPVYGLRREKGDTGRVVNTRSACPLSMGRIVASSAPTRADSILLLIVGSIGPVPVGWRTAAC